MCNLDCFFYNFDISIRSPHLFDVLLLLLIKVSIFVAFKLDHSSILLSFSTNHFLYLLRHFLALN